MIYRERLRGDAGPWKRRLGAYRVGPFTFIQELMGSDTFCVMDVLRALGRTPHIFLLARPTLKAQELAVPMSQKMRQGRKGWLSFCLELRKKEEFMTFGRTGRQFRTTTRVSWGYAGRK